MTQISIHPAAELFPLLAGAELEQLAADIGTNGLRDPIILYGGEVLDGRNRLAACELAGVEPRFEGYKGDDPVAFVISTNLHRRHLSAGQLAAVSLEALPMFEAEARGRQRGGRGGALLPEIIPEASEAGDSRDKVAEALGVNPRYVSDAKRIDAAAPELIQMFKADAINVPQAKELAKLDEGTRAQAIEKIEAGEAAAKVVKSAVLPVAFGSVSDQWFTPLEVLGAARSVLGGFDLDPASSAEANEVVRAAAFYTKEDDGLAQQWSGRVWLNPPYGRNDAGDSNQDAWSKHLIAEFKAGRVSSALLLVTFSPDRSWFQRLWKFPMCAFRNRIKFRVPGGSVPSSPVDANVIVGFGVELPTFIEHFAEFGTVLAPRSQCIEVWDDEG